MSCVDTPEPSAPGALSTIARELVADGRMPAPRLKQELTASRTPSAWHAQRDESLYHRGVVRRPSRYWWGHGRHVHL